MKIQVLVATTNQRDHSLIEKMKITTNAIVGNQSNFNSVEMFDYKNCKIMYLNFCERGVGLNRNNALMRADADICLFADDDIIYEDNYAEIIENAFLNNIDADVIIFNLRENIARRRVIRKKEKVGYMNYLRYGTVRIAVRLKSIKIHGIYFNQCFGGGTRYSHGEDNLFLNSCLKNGLKIIAVPDYIASLTESRISSWNNGYNEKYIEDQGVLYRIISRKWWRILCLQDAVRRHKSYKTSFYYAFMTMIRAVKKYNEDII